MESLRGLLPLGCCRTKPLRLLTGGVRPSEGLLVELLHGGHTFVMTPEDIAGALAFRRA